MHRMYKLQASQLERGMATGDEELKPGTQTTLVLSSCSIAAHPWPYVSMAIGDEELWPTWLKLCTRAYATRSRDGSWFFFSNSHFSFSCEGDKLATCTITLQLASTHFMIIHQLLFVHLFVCVFLI